MMHPNYDDITGKLGKPLWYSNQSAAIPRYDPFEPDMVDIYAKWVALCVIRCQTCREEFLVSVDYSETDRIKQRCPGDVSFPEVALPTADSGNWFDAWGDPPRHFGDKAGCTGETMTSELVRIQEFWMKDYTQGSPTFLDFVRHPEYEFDYSEALED